MDGTNNSQPQSDWLAFIETTEGFEQTKGLFSTQSDTSTIIQALRCVAVAERKHAITPEIAAYVVNRLANAVGCATDTMLDDYQTVKRVSSMAMAHDPAMQLAYLLLSDRLGWGCLVRHERDGILLEFRAGHWHEITPAKLKQALTDLCFASANLVPSLKPKLIKQALDHVQTIILREVSLHDISPVAGPLLNVSNGELWNKGTAIELRPHRPWSGQFAVSDVAYDPAATAPNYDIAVAEIFGNALDPDAMVRHWHEFAGYAIQSRRPIPSFWLLIGRGANGKSKLLEIVGRLVGPQALLAEPISRFQTDSFALSSLAGKKLLIDDDVDEDLILGDGLIKKLSEEKTVSARSPYGRKKRTFVSFALPVMAGNHYPSTKDISPGMQRRTYVMPFERIFEVDEQDPELFDAIWREERSGILNRFLAGLLRVIERGYQFDEPQDCVEARAKFFVESNPLRAFIAERCEIIEGSKTRISDIRAALRQWAQGNMIAMGSVGGNKLKRNLELLGFEIAQMKGYPYVRGLTIKIEI